MQPKNEPELLFTSYHSRAQMSKLISSSLVPHYNSLYLKVLKLSHYSEITSAFHQHSWLHSIRAKPNTKNNNLEIIDKFCLLSGCGQS